MSRNDVIASTNLSTPGAVERFRAVVAHECSELWRAVRAKLPGAGKTDSARVQLMRSENMALRRWSRAPYGTSSKPAALGDIPWDYVAANADSIPFLGLREYWYPALKSEELPHNKVVPATLLGDAIAFFRSADNQPRALEDRCPHRGPLLSLGQVGVVRPGTLTCRYHGMTFDGSGDCVAVVTDGPDSPACGKVKARSYPVEEMGGIVWVYMGEKTPQPVLDSVPHAREVFGGGKVFVDRGEWSFNYLSALDNDVDLAHPSILHRTCVPFSDQKVWGLIDAEEAPCGGTRVFWQDDDVRPHAGPMIADEVDWHLPNVAFFGNNELGGPISSGYFWAVPRDIGNCARWFIFGAPPATGMRAGLNRFALKTFFGQTVLYPGAPLTCSDGADAAMMAAQGRVPRWDRDRLIRTDIAITRVRGRVRTAYAEERATRAPSASETALAEKAGHAGG